MPETDQDEMTAYVRDICPHCGNLRAACSNPAGEWYPQRSMCYALADHQVLLRRMDKRYGHPSENDLQRHPTDGMSVWVAAQDLSPEDSFI